MLDTTTGNLRLAHGVSLGPGTRKADVLQLLAAPRAADQPSGLTMNDPETGELNWIAKFDDVEGEFLITAQFLNDWLGEIRVCYAGMVPRNRKEAVMVFCARHAELLVRWAVSVPFSRHPWGAVSLEESNLPDDEDVAEPCDRIRIDYTQVPVEAEVERGTICVRLAFRAFVIGLALLAWCIWGRPVLAEAEPGIDGLWCLGLGLFGVAGLLALVGWWREAMKPLSEREAWRWPCPRCRSIGRMGHWRLWRIDTSQQLGDRWQCGSCSALFFEDSMSYHPVLEAETPPRQEHWRRWPDLDCNSSMPERFHESAPSPVNDAERETELRAFVKALESGLRRGAGWGAAILAVVLLPGWAFLFVSALSAGSPNAAAAAVAVVAVGWVCMRVTDRRACLHRWHHSYTGQIERFQNRLGMSKDEFRRRVLEIAGPRSALVRILGLAPQKTGAGAFTDMPNEQ